MADEQTPQSDLVEDALRQAERQLEEKIEALRLSALGEPAPQATAPDDLAVLRPTGTGSRTSPRPEPTDPVDDRTLRASAWQETGGDDVSFAPASGSAHPAHPATDLFVPETDDPFDAVLDEAPVPTEDPAASVFDEADDDSRAASLRDSLSATVTDLTPVWEDEDEDENESASAASYAPDPTTRPRAVRSAEPVHEPATTEPVRPAWSEAGRARREPAARTTPPSPSLPSEDEMQFWAHTRTALRNLQQVTDGLPTQVVGGVSTEFSRLLHEELSTTEQVLRSLQDQLRHVTGNALPAITDDLQAAVEQSLTAPNNALRQLRDEVPVHLERANRQLHDTLRDDLDRTSAGLHAAVQHDVNRLEQSIASNVTRMAQDSSETIGRVERDVDVLGETVVRFERGVHAEFDRFEAQLRSAIERVETNLREELVEPTELVRKLEAETPSRFSRIERTIQEQLQSGQREQATTLTSLVEADRAALDRLASLASTLDEDRARRAEDLDVVVDTVTNGWEALAGAMTALFEQAEQNSRRLAGIEQRLLQIRDLEGAVERTLDDFTHQMRELKPSPIVVTVSHDEAEVRNTTRSGWVPDDA